MTDPTLLDYYARRIQEYEQIYQKPERQAKLALLKAYLAGLLAGRDVLEVACGTGYGTAHLAPFTRSILATDAAGEVLDVARAKAYPLRRVPFEQADAYALDTITGAFSAGFAGFWWSHVPKARLPGFLSTFHGKLQPGARVVFVDNQYVEGSSTPRSATDPDGNTYQERRLADGSRHRILKNFPTDAALRSAVGDAGTNVRYVDFTYYWCLSYALRE
ncbi:MAG: class I SAM-dependent methyltransferase [Bacteroidetes bacterium]|nr:class I SAM-dependent methyltransferase [Bacteroidota bacterium]